MKAFENPSMEIVKLEVDDVITASAGENFETNPGEENDMGE